MTLDYIPVQSPPKSPPPDDFMLDNYKVLVPLQPVAHDDYDPLINGEITRRVPWPRSLFTKPYAITLEGSTSSPANLPRSKSYVSRAKLKVGHAMLYKSIYDDMTDQWVYDPKTDPAATVRLMDARGMYWGNLYEEKTNEAHCVLAYRDGDDLIKIGYAFFRPHHNTKVIP